ncbi:Uncharacterised protein [uncultured Blautia sp.]|nr:Uncharacterised protein [uncultured Blautia sp.]
MDGRIRQLLLPGAVLHLIGHGVQRLVEAPAEGGVPVGDGPVPLQLLPDQQIHIPGGHHPLQHTDSGEIGQVVPVVFLPLRPGHQAALRVVVHHSGGEAVILVEPDHLPVHIAEHLVHI